MNSREESVENTLAGGQGMVCCVLLGHRTRCTNRPELHHGVFRRLALKLGFQNNILQEPWSISKILDTPYRGKGAYIDVVAALLGDMCNGTHSPWRHHDLVSIDKGVLIYATEDISTGEVVSNLWICK